MIRDTNLVLRASAGLTATATGAEVDFGGPDMEPLTYVLNITALTGATGIMACKIQGAATTAGTYFDICNFPLPATAITAVGIYRVTAKSPYRYRKYVATLSGTTPNFTFNIYPELGGQYQKF